ncbi:CARDB domain-containing protein [Halobaculum limi]|uniref:CARDB domain-containing protein n=1 Tax=Halobaculum limi TaxID=3031916 RepID=UPI002407757E|nr:CARDB domain-containing protein [Halobaculum sp. YSMS11]
MLITVSVENTGDTSGTKDIRITASGSQVATRSVTVDAGSTKTIDTTVSFGTARSYLIRANGVRLGTVEVTEGSTAPGTDVIETSSGATINIGEARIGQQVTVGTGQAVTQGSTGLTGLEMDLGDSTGGFRVEVTPPQASPPAGRPAVDEARDGARGLFYFEATPLGSEVPVFNGVTYKFSVATPDLPDGVTPEQVVLLRYNTDEERWAERPTTYLGNEEYEAQSPGFSSYAIGVRVLEPTFSIQETGITTREPAVGEETTVEATIANTGDASGTFTANLTVNGAVLDEQSVELSPGESQTVEFTVSFDETGAYDVAVSGQAAAVIEVVEAQAPSERESVTEESETQVAVSTETPLHLVERTIVGVGIFGVVLGAIYFRSRREDDLDDTSGDAVTGTADTDSRLDAVDDLVSDAEAARANGNFDTAVETYDEVLEEYTAIRETLPADDDQSDEVETAVTAAQTARSEVATLATTKEDVEETLAAAERQFLEGIIAHVQGESVLAKTRYRSARSRFEESTDLLSNVDATEVLETVSVTPETQASLSQLPESLESHPDISAKLLETLAETDVTTPADLADSDLDLEEQFTAVEADDDELLATLTALSWWHEPDEEKEWTLEEIERRIDQAGQGRRACL